MADLCVGIDIFEVSRQQMVALVGAPAFGLYLHGSVFVRDDLDMVFKESVLRHECTHAQQESAHGPATSWKEWRRRECEAEKAQNAFLAPYGRRVIGVCNTNVDEGN